ncbi:hypothetical protein [Actinomadura sp. 6N118]|uniref:hypothetical protein n=1 Tax=Actinomadura sp. 6N118 TaxID=3375151 RepID=UPI0037A7D79C
MSTFQVSKVLFERVDHELLDHWDVRVYAFGEGFEERALNVRATVGNQEVEGITTSSDGSGFTGYLRNEPPNGAKLRVGYEALEDTGLAFEGPPIPPIPPVREPNV